MPLRTSVACACFALFSFPVLDSLAASPDAGRKEVIVGYAESEANLQGPRDDLLPSRIRDARTSPGVLHFRHDATRPNASSAVSRAYGPASSVSVPDGAGGLYVAWADIRDGSGDIFLQRVTNTGAAAAGWPAEGVTVCDAPGDQFEFVLMPDGTNGALIAWVDNRDDWKTADGYAQRFNSSGVAQWTANGVLIVPGLAVNDADVAPDGTGGLIVAWSKMITDRDIFAVRYTGAGALAAGFSSGGNTVCAAVDDQISPMVTGDGAGSAIIAWEDGRAGGGETHVYAQRMSAGGVGQWASDGIQLDTGIGASTPDVCSDAASGAFVFWTDLAGVLMGQRVNNAGVAQWTAGGLSVDGSAAEDGGMEAVSDGGTGAIIAWHESPGTIGSLRAQSVNSAGAAQWGASGVSIVSTAGSNPNPPEIVPIAGGGAYFVWEDNRGITNVLDSPDLYAQRVASGGSLSWAANGVAVCTSSGTQMKPSGAPDGSGGLLVAWQDTRTFDTDIFVQRFNAAGTAQFAANGIAAFSNPGVQVGALILHSDAGGPFVFWNEKRNGQYDIRARKFNSDGTPATASVLICSAAGHQGLNAVIDDGAGGAIVAWIDRRGSSDDLYAQRVDASLTPLWTANGVAICAAGGEQQNARMVSDGSSGAILAWQDDRNGAGNSDVYAQRVNSLGAVQWTADGVAVCSDPNSQVGAVLTSDGLGGAIIAWSDFRTILTPAVYAQRLYGSGVAQWTANGVNIASFGIFSILRVSEAVPGLANDAIILISKTTVDVVTGDFVISLVGQKVNSSGAPQWGASGSTICDVTSFCSHEAMVNDGAGGAYVAWSDGRNQVFDIYMQRVNATGAPQWTANGVAVCNASGWQLMGGLMRDAGGDAYLDWEDERGGQPDIYAQRFNAAGAAQWAANGVLVCSAAHGQYFATIAPWKTAAPGRVYVAWTDNRASTARYVYAQRLDVNGVAQWTGDGIVRTTLALVSSTAAPDRVSLLWYASESVAAKVYRRTDGADWALVGEVFSDGRGQIAFEDRDVVPGGRYGYRLGFIESGREVFAGEAWVEVPATLRFALDGLVPNPAVGALTASFTLPSADRATLEIVDVHGRRVLARDLTGLSPGHHALRLDGALPAGIYFVKLTQHDFRATARAVVMR